MENDKYTVDMSSDEIHSLIECLVELRKTYVNDYDNSSNGVKPLDQPVFIVACELHHKFAQVVSPKSKTTVDDYLDYGKR